MAHAPGGPLPGVVRRMDAAGGLVDTHWRYGEVVRLAGLNSDRWNGAVAVVSTWDRVAGRFAVRVVRLASGEPCHQVIKVRPAHVAPLDDTALSRGDPAYAAAVAEFDKAMREDFPGFVSFKAMTLESLEHLVFAMKEVTEYGGCTLLSGDCVPPTATAAAADDAAADDDDPDDADDPRFRRFEALLLAACRHLWAQTDPNHHMPPQTRARLGEGFWKQLFQAKVVKPGLGGLNEWPADVLTTTDSATQGRAFMFATAFGSVVGAMVWRTFVHYPDLLCQAKRHPVLSNHQLTRAKAAELEEQLTAMSPEQDSVYEEFLRLDCGKNFTTLFGEGMKKNNEQARAATARRCASVERYLKRRAGARRAALRGVSREQLENAGLLEAVQLLLMWELNASCYRLAVMTMILGPGQATTGAFAGQQPQTTGVQLVQLLVAELVYFTSGSNTYNKSKEAMAYFGLCMFFRGMRDEAIHYMTASRTLYKRAVRQHRQGQAGLFALVTAMLKRSRMLCVSFGIPDQAQAALYHEDPNHPKIPAYLRRDAMVRQGTWCRVVSKKGKGCTGLKARDATGAGRLRPRCGAASCVVGKKLYIFGGIEIQRSNPVGDHLPLVHKLFEARACTGAHAAMLQVPKDDLLVYDMQAGTWEVLENPNTLHDAAETETASPSSPGGKKKKKKKKKKKRKKKKSPSGPWPSGRGMACLAHAGDALYLCGGRTSWHVDPNAPGQSFPRDMWRFDLATRTWTEVAIATGLGPRLRSTCAHGIVDDVWFVVDPLEEYPSKRPKTTVQCFDLRAKRWLSVPSKRVIKYSPDAAPCVTSLFGKVTQPTFTYGKNATQTSGWLDGARDTLYVFGATCPPKHNDVDLQQAGLWALSGLRQAARALRGAAKSVGKRLRWRNYLFRPNTVHTWRDHLIGTMPAPVSEASCCFDPVTRKAYVFGGWNHDMYTMGCGRLAQGCMNSGKYYGTLHEIDMDHQIVRVIENWGKSPTATVLGPSRRGYPTLGAWTPPPAPHEGEAKDGKPGNTTLVCGFGYTSFDKTKGQFSSIDGHRDVWTCDIQRTYTAVADEEEEDDDDDHAAPISREEQPVQGSLAGTYHFAINPDAPAHTEREKARRRVTERIIQAGGMGVQRINLSAMYKQYHLAVVNQRGAADTIVHRKQLTLLAPPSRGRGAFVLKLLRPDWQESFTVGELERCKVDGTCRLSDEDFWAERNLRGTWRTEAEIEARFPGWTGWCPDGAAGNWGAYDHTRQVYVLVVLQERQEVLDLYRQNPPAGVPWSSIVRQVDAQMPHPATLNGIAYGRWLPNAGPTLYVTRDADTGELVVSGQQKCFERRDPTATQFGLSNAALKKMKRAMRALCCSNDTCPTLSEQQTHAHLLVLEEFTGQNIGKVELARAKQALPKLKKCECMVLIICRCAPLPCVLVPCVITVLTTNPHDRAHFVLLLFFSLLFLPLQTCAHPSRRAAHTGSRCQIAHYCCGKCQKLDWKNGHKKTCKKR